ncbi:SRPBCC family protein [Pseudarthrobacter sp. P1]|uniref:SRPBCC family protein n=1 Tax=Pseudarthrobacter sp. P1 TaxID=3418418 RepID=UPI003CF5D042
MSTYAVTRNALINAPAAELFALVNNFNSWTQWSPWETVDPTMERTYSGSESGVGAKYAWSGNSKAGSGNMEIVETSAPGRINIRLEFTKPFKAVNPNVFTFAPEGGGTRVTWTMSGENKGIAKIFALFMNMDKMVGKDFEKGLSQLALAVAK